MMSDFNIHQQNMSVAVATLSIQQDDLNDAVEMINKNIFNIMKMLQPEESKDSIKTEKSKFGLNVYIVGTLLVLAGITGTLFIGALVTVFYLCYKKCCGCKKTNDEEPIEDGKLAKPSTKFRSNSLPKIPVTHSLYRLTQSMENVNTISKPIAVVEPLKLGEGFIRKPAMGSIRIGKKVESPRVPKRDDSTKLSTFFDNVPELETPMPDIRQVDFQEKTTRV